MKRLLDQNAQDTVTRAVAACEEKTRAEIITVLAPASDSYRVWAWLWAACTALAFHIITTLWASSWAPAPWLHGLPIITVVFFICTGLTLSGIPHLLRLVVPKSVQKSRAAAMARMQFLAQNLHQTREQTGVLFFVSEFERYVEVLVDRGVAAHVPDNEWKALVDEFTARVRAGEIEKGFAGALDRAATLLADKLPPQADNPNELPNRLVVL